MDKKIKALFFDIDGTLVSFRTHKIPQSTVDALEEAKRNGVAVYISTGRPIMLINNLGQIEHLIDGYITTNGARCFVGNHTVCLHPILRADVDEVVADADVMIIRSSWWENVILWFIILLILSEKFLLRDLVLSTWISARVLMT